MLRLLEQYAWIRCLEKDADMIEKMFPEIQAQFAEVMM